MKSRLFVSKNPFSRLALSALLSGAGMVHLFQPELFLPAIPRWLISLHNEINLFAACVELTLAVTLWIPKLQDHAAKLSALWFLTLTPIHLYVSVNGISIFGVSNPLLLWIRTLLQAGLFFWALSLQTKGWILSQKWSEVLFLHFKVDPKELSKLVPYPLDLYQGQAVVSIVPFIMSQIRFPFFPPIFGLSKLTELNLRTYVVINQKPVVYFLTLDSDHWIGVQIAKYGFSLPYRHKKMVLKRENESENQDLYHFKSAHLQLRAKISHADAPQNSDFEIWATERYALITRKNQTDYLGRVEHEKWNLKKAELIEINDRFSLSFVQTEKLMGASYCKSLNVKFRPFQRLNFSAPQTPDSDPNRTESVHGRFF